jgi:hypothetical protein
LECSKLRRETIPFTGPVLFSRETGAAFNKVQPLNRFFQEDHAIKKKPRNLLAHLLAQYLFLGYFDATSGVKFLKEMAEPTGLEPATSDVTGRRSNQLNYDSAKNLTFQLFLRSQN